jgi:hypothetical protein
MTHASPPDQDQHPGPFVHLYRIPNYDERNRFEEFRRSRGKPPYFQDPVFGQNLPASGHGFYCDVADLDDFERTWLAGMGATLIEGLRLPYHEKPTGRHSSTFDLIERHFREDGYTIWPTTHVLLVVEHRLIQFLGAALYPAAATLPSEHTSDEPLF